MAQKSITSFFSVQKKKIDEAAPPVVLPKVETPEKCEAVRALNEVTSPLNATKRRGSKRMVMSSDEDENLSPSKERGKSSDSASSSDDDDAIRKSGRKKVVKGASALREIKEKRAAKKARLASQESEVVADQQSHETEPTQSVENRKEAVKDENEEIKTEEKTSQGLSNHSASPEETIGDNTSDLSDAEEQKATKAVKKAVPVKKAAKKPASAKKTAAKPKVEKKPAKKSPTTGKKTSVAIASFFAPVGKKGDGSTSAGDSSKPSEKVEIPEYNPSKSRYNPIEDATWERGKPVPYLALARTLECIEEISARLKMAEILSNFLRSVIILSPDNLVPCIYLCLNKLAPAFEGLELGLAERSLIKAVAVSTGRSEKQILEETEEEGDLGIVAQNSCGRQAKLFRPPPLSVPAVFNQLKGIASMKGKDSMSRKVDKVVAMYNACKPIETRFLIRSLTGKLRIGLAEQTALQGLALACVTTPPGQEYPPPILNASDKMSADAFKAKLDEQALILKTTYCECPVYDKIIPMLLEHGIEELPQRCQISPGIPLRPMLAHPTKGVAEVLTRFDGRKFTCEWKYDGERAQVHISDSSVRIFSRNQEDNTSKYPEVTSRLVAQLSETVKECILDCEAVAWDREANRILPFQVLSTRKKKDANEADIKVQVCLFVFDLLYINGEPLVRVPLDERRKKLRQVVQEVPGQLQFAESLDTDNLDEVQAYLEQSVKGNCEGLMVKTLEVEATYEIAKRSRNWLKLKKDYLEGVGDTLDLVVLGGYLGRGKRAGVYGGFLLGCYDPHTEEYQSICKIGTGFSDESLQTHSDFFKGHILQSGPRRYYRFDHTLAPDHWFDAVQVWEVKCADLSLSPVHKAAMGIVDSEKGISLRFPRFLRIRDDKKVEEATSAAQVADLYKNQDQVKNQGDSNKTAEEDDFY